MPPTRLLVSGALGRMGSKVLELAARDKRFTVVAGIARGDRAGAPLLPERELPLALRRADVLIEFTEPAATLAHLAVCARLGKAAVIGTTGFSEKQRATLRSFSKKIALFVSPNMSPAMNALFRLARDAAAALGGYDAHVHETHHRYKKDAPSGTALRLAEAVREGGGRFPGISSARVGEIVGEHTLVLAGPFERLELTHRADSREAFAAGALRAAAWLKGRKPGLYDFSSIL